MISARHLVQFFVYLSLCTFCLSSAPHQLLADLPQTLTFVPEVPISFQILKLSTSQIGDFHIMISSENHEMSSKVFINRKACLESEKEDKLNSEPIIYNEGESILSFNGDTKETNCFEVMIPGDSKLEEVQMTVLIRFSPYFSLIKSGQSYSFGFDSNSKKEFAINLTDLSTEIITIKLTNSLVGQSDSLYLQLKQTKGSCSQFEPLSWICFIGHHQGTIRFEVINPKSASEYTILAYEVQPQRILFEVDAQLQANIPGLGSLFAVTLPLPGVLKVIASAQNNKRLSVVASTSLETLYNAISQDQSEIPYLDVRASSEEGLFVQNKESNSQWFYFVKEKSQEPFHLVSYFNRQIVLNLDVEAMYYIDPSIYEYQYIELKLGNRNFPEKFDIVLQAEQSDSLMNIYYDTNSYEISYSLFPDKNFYRKKAAPVPTKENQLALSFIVGTHDTSAYITIQALTKGFYTVRATKIEPRSVWQGIFFVGTLSSLIAYIFSCITRIFKFVKSDDFDDFPEWMQYNASANSSMERPVQDLEAQVEIQENRDIDPYGRNEAFNRFVRMIRKLKKQEKIERKEKLGRQKQAQENSIERIEEESNDDDMCAICYEVKRSVTFQPCKHACTCAHCALVIIETSSKCPLCRAEIVKVEINNTNQSQGSVSKEISPRDVTIDIKMATPNDETVKGKL